MSAGVSASVEAGNVTWTVFDPPAGTSTRAKPTSRCGGTTMPAVSVGSWTNTGTTSVPSFAPVFATVKVTVPDPPRDTDELALSPLAWNVVYESPKPNG